MQGTCKRQVIRSNPVEDIGQIINSCKAMRNVNVDGRTAALGCQQEHL